MKLIHIEYKNRLNQLEEVVAEEMREAEAEQQKKREISKILDTLGNGAVVAEIIYVKYSCFTKFRVLV